MNSSYTLLDHVGSLPAKAVHARAHRLHLNAFGLGNRCTTRNPTKFRISNPSLFSARGSNPYLGFASAVSDCKRPLGVELNDIGVGNNDGAQGIYNFDMVTSENQFGFNPNQVGGSRQNQTDRKFKNVLSRACCNQHAVDGKEKDQYKRHTRPDKVAAGSKGFIHILSIAGETK